MAFVAPTPLTALRPFTRPFTRPSSTLSPHRPQHSHTPSPARMTLAPHPPQPPSTAPAVDSNDPVEPINGLSQYLDTLSTHADRLLVMQVYAPWCRSCRALHPKVTRLAHEFPEVKFVKMDLEQNRQLCARIAVVSMPTFVFYYGQAGEVEKFSCGPKRASLLREKLVQCLLGRCLLEDPSERIA